MSLKERKIIANSVYTLYFLRKNYLLLLSCCEANRVMVNSSFSCESN